MVSERTPGPRGRISYEMADNDRGSAIHLGNQADENPVGHLQSKSRTDLAQPGAGKKADFLHRVRCRARAATSDRKKAQQALRLAHEPAFAEMEKRKTGTEPVHPRA